jgi:hypothetical protein
MDFQKMARGRWHRAVSWRPWIAVFAAAASQVAAAQSAPAAAASAANRIIEVTVVDSARPVTLSKSFEVSWPHPPGEATWRLDHWKGPGSAQPELVPEVKLDASAGGKLRVEVGLKNVTSVGVHSGQLVLAPEPSVPGGSQTFDVRFVTTFRPAVAVAPSGTVTLKVSNCRWPCFLTEVFAPEVRGRTYAFELKNSSPAPIDVNVRFAGLGLAPAEPALVLRKAGAKEGEGSKSLDLLDIPANGSAHFQASVDNAPDLVAGSYAGSLQFLATPASIRGAPEYLVGERATDGAYVVRNAVRTDLGANVLVREPVLWALLVVLAGLIAGRMAGAMATAGFEQKLALFPRHEALQARLGRIQGGLHTRLSHSLREAWDGVLEGGNPQTSAQALSKLEKQFDFAEQALALQARIGSLPADRQAEARAKLVEALTELEKAAPNFEVVIAALGKVEGLLAEKPPAVVTESVAGAAPRAPQPPSGSQRVLSALSLLAGTGTDGIGFYYRYGRPIFHLTLLAMLVTYGLWQHYCGGADAATFGSQGITQYAILFLWGMTTDFMNKALQTLTFKRT